MKIRKLAVILLLLVLAAGIVSCAAAPGKPGFPGSEEDLGSISSRRAGVYREGLPFPGRCTASETGVYLMCPVDFADGNSWPVLFYTDYGSDSLTRVCSRPDCSHDDMQCDASLSEASVISFHDGYLYSCEITQRNEFDYRLSLKLIRIDPDGRNRTCIIDTQYDARFDEGDFGFPMFTDGMFFFQFSWLNEKGEAQRQSYYYKLDGSMKAFQPVDISLLYGTDKNTTFFFKHKAALEYSVWNAEEMSVTPLFTLDPETSCYMATENAFIMTDNKIYKKDYDTGEETLLFDTGLEGTHRMICFPDCIVIRNAVAYDGSEPELKQQTLRFYSWEFEPLGEITLDFALLQGTSSPICAETPDKLLICTDISGIPRYYIDKSEFGTGHITLHEFKLPMGFQQ